MADRAASDATAPKAIDRVTEIEFEAIVKMVHAGIPYQARVSRIMRTITEALTFGEYCNSTVGKQRNRKMSREAELLMQSMHASAFVKQTVLEHPEPLKRSYAQLQDIGRVLNVETARLILEKHPLVTITKREDDRLRKLKLSDQGDPKDRYEIASIEVVEVDTLLFKPIEGPFEIPTSEDDDPSRIDGNE